MRVDVMLCYFTSRSCYEHLDILRPLEARPRPHTVMECEEEGRRVVGERYENERAESETCPTEQQTLSVTRTASRI